MYQGIESGAITTKKAEKQRLIEQQAKWDKITPAIDMRKNKNGG